MNPCPKNIPPKHEGKAYTKFRKEVYDIHGPHCANCKRWLPLYELTQDGKNVFDVFTCAHVAHGKRRAKIGDDVNQCKIKCYRCHIEIEHGPQWGKGA